MMHQDQVGFSLGIQHWFKMWKSVNQSFTLIGSNHNINKNSRKIFYGHWETDSKILQKPKTQNGHCGTEEEQSWSTSQILIKSYSDQDRVVLAK